VANALLELVDGESRKTHFRTRALTGSRAVFGRTPSLLKMVEDYPMKRAHVAAKGVTTRRKVYAGRIRACGRTIRALLPLSWRGTIPRAYGWGGKRRG